MVSAFSKSLLTEVRAAGLSLDDEAARRFEVHYDLLRSWGKRMNLTGLKSTGEIVRRHFLEPIAAADLLENSGRLIDLGSGSGFPAIPLNILRPGLDLVLVEASEKKSGFLWAALRELGLKRARVETRHVRGVADLTDLLPTRYLTCRAVRLADVLGGEGPPVLGPGGRALLFLAARQVEEIERRPPIGLVFAGSRPLPGVESSRLVIMEPATSR